MSKRGFEVSDQALWDDIKKSISPITKSRKAKTRKATFQKLPMVSEPRFIPLPNQIPRAYRSAPPELASFDRRTAQKLGRGQLEPEARLDLHGESLETARLQLLHFVSSRRMQGQRLVLVITGKGASPFARHTLHGVKHFHTPEREGRLRREVPLWLEEAQFRLHVIGFQPAHPRHGGGGAFYLRLRKHLGEHE